MKACQHEIKLNHRLLTNSYNIDEIEKIEAEVRKKRELCTKLQKDNKRISKWMKQSERDIDNIGENGFYKDEASKLANEYRQDKAKIRELYYDNLRKRKELIEKHEVVVQRENNIRKMKELIETSRRDKSQNPKIDMAKPESVVSGREWDVDEIKKKVDAAKRKMKIEQNNTEKEASRQSEQIRDIEHQLNILNVKVKEKDKELSLATLKIKELKRNLRYNSLKPLLTTPGNLTERNDRKIKNQK